MTGLAMQASAKRWQCCISTSTGLASKQTSPLTSSSVMRAKSNALSYKRFLNSTFLACQDHLSIFISTSPDLLRSDRLRCLPAKAAGVATNQPCPLLPQAPPTLVSSSTILRTRRNSLAIIQTSHRSTCLPRQLVHAVWLPHLANQCKRH
jgi:hypothetical protein